MATFNLLVLGEDSMEDGHLIITRIAADYKVNTVAIIDEGE